MWATVSTTKLRFTPTRVGNTTAATPASSRMPVHPHACGEYVGNTAAMVAHTGSPPRVWGIRPAYRSGSMNMRGSPPRVWGIRVERTAAVDKHSRFTPTRVGNTMSPAIAAAGYRFTPTRVGNTNRVYYIHNVLSGSPPRVWGIRASPGRGRC